MKVIAALNGGLGNQMFQYAAARALALRDGKTLLLDAALLGANDEITRREYELAAFHLQAPLAPANICDDFAWRPTHSFSDRLRQRLSRALHPRHVVEEESPGWRGPLPRLRGDVYLRGYWQDERYFSAYGEQVRRDFAFREPLSPRSSAVARGIEETPTCFIHVRRGDYVQHPRHAPCHGACPREYFHDAAKLVRSRTETQAFAVFSDDPAWCREMLCDLPGVYFVDGQNSAATTADHLRLMSMCQHAVIANSSYSWWAAWLITHPAKVVVAPKRWMADPQANEQMAEITPPAWIRL